MKPRSRRLKVAALGGVLTSAAAVAGIIWPARADFLLALALGLNAFLVAIAAFMAVDDSLTAKVDIAAIVASSQVQEAPNA